MNTMNVMGTKKAKLADLTPHPKNVRQGDVGALAESLKAHGQYRPIVAQQSTGYILAGNHTYKAAHALGWKEILVTFIDVDDEQALRILLIDNRANDLATYNDDGLAELLKQLAATDKHLEGTGFDGDDLDDLLFRLNGSTGFLTEGLSVAERTEEWAERGVRSIILPYPEEEWRDITDHLKTLRERYSAESNAEVVAKLVKDACA